MQELHKESKTKRAKSTPNLTYRGGSLLSNVEVFTIFWGSEWETGTLKDMITKINTFYQAILKSTLMDQLGEYNTPGYLLGKGTLTGSLKDNSLFRSQYKYRNRSGNTTDWDQL